MAIFTVHAPPAREGERAAADPVRFSFVKDGFTWLALVVPVIWLAVHRMWLVLLAYLVVAIAFAFASAPLVDPATTAIAILFAFLFALEAGEIRRWTLNASGWRMIGVAEGRNRVEAERNFFAREADAPRPAVPPVPPTPPRRTEPVQPPTATSLPVVGLFPEPGRK